MQASEEMSPLYESIFLQLIFAEQLLEEIDARRRAVNAMKEICFIFIMSLEVKS